MYLSEADLILVMLLIEIAANTEDFEGPERTGAWKLMDKIQAHRKVPQQPETIAPKIAELQFAGWFSEYKSGMSYRLWEQGGHERNGDDVALYELSHSNGLRPFRRLI